MGKRNVSKRCRRRNLFVERTVFSTQVTNCLRKKNTRRNLVCWPRCFSIQAIRACPFTASKKTKIVVETISPFLPHPLRPSLPRDAEQQTQQNMLPLSSENCIFFGEAQHARWTLSGSKGHTTILLSLFAVFKQNIWGDHFPSFARRKINQWSNLRKTHTYPHAHEPSTATHQDVPVSSSKFSNYKICSTEEFGAFFWCFFDALFW